MINSCVLRRDKLCYFLGSDQRPLVVDVQDKIGYFDDNSDYMSLSFLPNHQIIPLKIYTLWYFRKDGEIIFFDTSSQNEIREAYKYLALNRRCN